MLFGINTELQSLLRNAKAADILERYLPGVRDLTQNNARAGQLSVEQMVHYTKRPDAQELLAQMDEALKKLNETETLISPEEEELICRFRRIQQEYGSRAARSRTHTQDAIHPGLPWLDTKGERIQAHGGAVYYEKGIYYWYGENKEFTDGKNGVWTWGIRAYSSADLCNWDDLGLIIPPDIEDPNASLFPAKRVDRPHIIRSPRTGKYVCWIKLSGPEAAFTVWQADSLLGPYEQVESLYNPGGYKIGDFDIVMDPDSGQGYIYFDADHKAMVCMSLTADCLHADQELVRNYPDLHPPFTREAPCLFAANGIKYMVTSGMTGYVPNKSDSAAAGTWDSLFTSLGDPHENDPSCASFNSQISKIFPVAEQEGLFIAMADRWLPEHPVDARVADLYTRVVGSNYDPEQYQATEEERREMYARSLLVEANTSIAEYVWLPLKITPPDENHPFGQVHISWQDRWIPDSIK